MRCVGSDAEPSTPIAFALSTALFARRTEHHPVSAVLSTDDPPGRAELSTGWYVPTAGAWYEARAGRVPARAELSTEWYEAITARVPAPPRAPPAPITARADSLESRGEVEEEADERQQRLQTSEVEDSAQHGASDRSDEDSSDGWETVSEDG
jgi:hypothetical protein